MLAEMPWKWPLGSIAQGKFVTLAVNIECFSTSHASAFFCFVSLDYSLCLRCSALPSSGKLRRELAELEALLATQRLLFILQDRK